MIRAMNPTATLSRALRQWIKHVLLRPWMFCTGPSRPARVALTFDDGPHPVHTLEVLRELDRFGAKASFFCVGDRLREHPRIAAEMRQRGHEIANHSMTHAEFATIGSAEITEEFDRAFALAAADGTPIMAQHLVRPPKGIINAAVLHYCSKRGVRIAYWNRDPQDYDTDSAEVCMAEFIARPLKAGDIVLLHDKFPHSAALVRQLLQSVQALGLEAVSVSTLVPFPTAVSQQRALGDRP